MANKTDGSDDHKGPGRWGMALWLRLVLFASLALNLLVVGIVAGFVFGGTHDRGRGHMGRDAALPYVGALRDADRDELRRALGEELRDRRTAKGQLAAQYRDAVVVLRTEPFEREALEAVMAAQAARAQARSEAGRTALIDRLAAMSPEARRAYADRLAAQIDRLERRWAVKN